MVMIRHGGLVMMIRDWSPDMVMIRHGGMVMMIRDWSPDMVMIMVTWWHGDDDQRLEPRHGDDHGDMVMIRHGGMVAW